MSCCLGKGHRCYLALSICISTPFSYQVLAVSDIVVYRTRAERLHNDMFQFLSNASGAYLKHFTPELRALIQPLWSGRAPLLLLGPPSSSSRRQRTPSCSVMVGEDIYQMTCICDHTSMILCLFTGFFFMGFNHFFCGSCCPDKMSLLPFPCRFEDGRPRRHAAPEAFSTNWTWGQRPSALCSTLAHRPSRPPLTTTGCWRPSGSKWRTLTHAPPDSPG